MKATTVHVATADRYTLESALLIYSSKHHDIHVTRHDIVHGSQGPEIGAGKALGRRALESIVAAITKKTARHGVRGWLDPRVLYFSPQMLAWWRPAAPATVFFHRAPGKKGKRKEGTTPQPSLVFAVTGSRWYVWAVAGSDRPTPETPLMQAPYFNVYDNGRICNGNVELPKALTPQTIAGYEAAFFDSRFTHPNAARMTTGDTSELWKQLLAGQHAGFPDGELLATDAVLGPTLEALSGEDA